MLLPWRSPPSFGIPIVIAMRGAAYQLDCDALRNRRREITSWSQVWEGKWIVGVGVTSPPKPDSLELDDGRFDGLA